MLDTELSVINTMDMDVKAKELYKLKYEKPTHAVSQRCINFKDIERLAKQYMDKQDN